MAYRLPTTKLTLPYENISIPVNRVSDNTLYNEVIDKLEDNFEALLNYSTIVNNVSPNIYLKMYRFDTAQWITPSAVTPPDHDYKFIEVIQTAIEDEYLYVLSKSDSIQFFTSNIDSLSPLVLKTELTMVKNIGAQAFQNITSVTYSENRLYVYDEYYQNIFVYDISSMINNDLALNNAIILKLNVKITDLLNMHTNGEVYFITPTTIEVYNSSLKKITSYPITYSSPIDIHMDGEFIYVVYQDIVEIFNISGVKQSEFKLTHIESETMFTIKPSNSSEIVN